MPNKCDKKVWAAAREAWRLLKRDKVRAHLVGTAAISALGHEVPTGDVDFLCETMPTAGETLPPDPNYADGETSREMVIGQVAVNFILAGDARAPFMAVRPRLVSGVPVAPLKYSLQLKKRADRPKDRKFFAEHPALARKVK